MSRPAVVVALPTAESTPVLSELADAGFEAFAVSTPGELEAVLEKHPHIAVAILDGETDLDASLESYSLLQNGVGRSRRSWSCRSARSTDSRPGPPTAPRTNISPAHTPPTPCAGASRRCASAVRPSMTAVVRSSTTATCRSRAGTGAPRSSRSSIPRAASARRPWPRTWPRPSRYARAETSCSSMPTPSPGTSRRPSRSTLAGRSPTPGAMSAKADRWRPSRRSRPSTRPACASSP